MVYTIEFENQRLVSVFEEISISNTRSSFVSTNNNRYFSTFILSCDLI